MATHRYWISYDVPDDLRRGRLSALLDGHGVRIQYSVFECVLTDRELRRLLVAASAIVSAGEDSLVLYECAATGYPKHRWLAQPRDSDADYWLA
jgi:CRISPR-associated protein Cas2